MLALLIGFVIGWLSKSLVSDLPTTKSNKTNDLTPSTNVSENENKPPQKCLNLFIEVPEEKYDWIYFSKTSPSYCKQTYALTYIYFKKGQKYRYPSFLSEYTFFMVKNYSHGEDGVGYSSDSFSEAYHGQSTKRETENFEVVIYPNSPDGIWALALLKEEHSQEGLDLKLKDHAYVYLHANNMADFENMLVDIDNIKITDDFRIPNKRTNITNFDWHVPQPNYTDQSGLYRYFLPPGYYLQEAREGWNNQIFEKPDEGSLCLSLFGAKDEPCEFSTSGCICCNVGCSLIDIALYADIYGYPVIEKVLARGDGIGQKWTAFRYSAEISHHLWVYWSAYFSGNNFLYKDGVKNLLKLISSIQRIYP